MPSPDVPRAVSYTITPCVREMMSVPNADAFPMRQSHKPSFHTPASCKPRPSSGADRSGLRWAQLRAGRSSSCSGCTRAADSSRSTLPQISDKEFAAHKMASDIFTSRRVLPTVRPPSAGKSAIASSQYGTSRTKPEGKMRFGVVERGGLHSA